MVNTKSILKTLLWSIPLLFFSGLMLRITYPYFSFRYDIGFLLTKQSVLHNAIWRWSFYIHISTSLLVLIFGIFQFIPFLLFRWPNIHRLIGKIYVVLVACLSAPSGFIMGIYANGGIWAKTSFCIISLLWFIFTLKAYLTIKNKNIDAHIDFMIRSYALTLTAITLRMYVVVLPHFFILHSREMYALISWLSWIPNLLLAEFLIRKKIFRPFNYQQSNSAIQ